MNRTTIIVLLIALAGFAAFRSTDNDTDTLPEPRPVPTETSDIAEFVHRERARRQAEVYSELAAAIQSGDYSDASSLGRDTVARIAAIEQDVGMPLQEDAAAQLPTGDIESPASVSEWYLDVAKGLRRVAK